MMSQAAPIQDKTQLLRVMQIIAGALIAGVCIFAVVALVVVGGQAPDGRFMTFFGAGFAVLLIATRAIVLPVMSSGMMKQKVLPLARGEIVSDDDRREMIESTELALYQLYHTKMTVGLGLLEGAAFMNIVVYIIEHNWWTFVVVGVLLAIMIAAIPTRNRVETWAAEQLRTLELET